MSVKQCQREIDSAEFSEWVAFNNVDNFMIDRAEYSVAILSAITASINSKKSYTYEDFLLTPEKKVADPREWEKQMSKIYGRN